MVKKKKKSEMRKKRHGKNCVTHSTNEGLAAL